VGDGGGDGEEGVGERGRCLVVEKATSSLGGGECYKMYYFAA